MHVKSTITVIIGFAQQIGIVHALLFKSVCSRQAIATANADSKGSVKSHTDNPVGWRVKLYQGINLTGSTMF